MDWWRPRSEIACKSDKHVGAGKIPQDARIYSFL